MFSIHQNARTLNTRNMGSIHMLLESVWLVVGGVDSSSPKTPSRNVYAFAAVRYKHKKLCLYKFVLKSIAGYLRTKYYTI